MIVEIAEEGRYVLIDRGFLVIKEKGTELGRVPLDTITALILSAQGITKNVFAIFASLNTPIVICGDNYAPVSMALPISAHYKQLEVASAQVSASSLFKAQLWQRIVQSKISNQAEALHQTNPEAAKVCQHILAYGKKVKAGDSDNYESNAARLYFPALFGKEFTRSTEEAGVNAMLNYTYAIIRACTGRVLCAAGLLPLFGVFHHNQLNPFCLADDLMEPLRPFADVLVHTLAQKESVDSLNPAIKRKLCSVIERPVLVATQNTSLLPALQSMAQSLARCFKTKSDDQLVLPSFPKP